MNNSTYYYIKLRYCDGRNVSVYLPFLEEPSKKDIRTYKEVSPTLYTSDGNKYINVCEIKLIR